MTLERKYVEKTMEKNGCSYCEACIQLGMSEEEIEKHIREEYLLYHLHAVEDKYIDKLIEMKSLFDKFSNIENDFSEMMAMLAGLNTLFGKVRMSYSDIEYFLKLSDHDYADYA